MNIAFKAPLEKPDSLDAIGRALFRSMGADGVYDDDAYNGPRLVRHFLSLFR
jgi:hypothetical protein